MKASIIAIGDELLIGQVQDTNSAWLASQLTALGIRIQSLNGIADQKEPIIEQLDRELKRSHLIILTGGLGPTKDDKTKETLTEYFQGHLVNHQETLDRISSWFEKRGMAMVEENISQAMVPSNCTVLSNYIGTAPGMWFDHDDKIIISLPGVPYEMQALFSGEVLPRLQKRLGENLIEHRTLVVSGIPESLLSKQLRNFENQLPDHIQLSYLPNFQHIRLRLTDYRPVDDRIIKWADQLRQEVTEYLIATEDLQIEEIIGRLLLERGQTVSFAESCTGGNIAHQIVRIPGSSRYFEGGVVAYSYDVKELQLGVDHEVLLEKGAVSQPVVEAMALAIRKLMNTNYSLAVSGIAGPGGATPDKPVGTVWVAAADQNGVHSKLFHFRGDREKIIRHTTANALEYLRKLIVS